LRQNAGHLGGLPRTRCPSTKTGGIVGRLPLSLEVHAPAFSARAAAGRDGEPKPKANAEKKRPTHPVFVVEGDGPNSFWSKIGAGWQHEDGDGLMLVPSSIPLAGHMVVRKAKPPTEREAASERPA
jgi:hypothetical protein